MMRRDRRGVDRRMLGMALLVGLLLLLTACGGGDGDSEAEGGSESSAQTEATAAPANAGRVVPTMPAARFAAPTTMIDATKVAESASTPAPEVADAAFGEQVYTRLCADCHGDALAGVMDKAEPIDAYALDVAALTDLLRTGGGNGPEHIFGLDKVSPEGIASLQAYLETLGGE